MRIKSTTSSALSLDLFCHVIDFFGDIGVCWRLARHLHRDFDLHVRLIVDDLSTFKRLVSAVDSTAASQNIDGVTVLKWDQSTLRNHYQKIADIVIEAFACTLPDFVVDMIKSTRPVWLDLEYLSAEAWVEECHARPSPHPRTGVDKSLFFPGFTEQTGGLIREPFLKSRRDAFLSDASSQNRWRERHGLPAIEKGTTDISLFCYPNAPFHTLLEAISSSKHPIRLFVTAGVDPASLDRAGISNYSFAYRVPFLSQEDYDHLLWTCSVNFVRGEDSLVRALWGGKPLIWHIYPQENAAHMAKLQAFLRRYTANLSPDYAQALENFTIMWNLRGREEGDVASLVDQDWVSMLVGLVSPLDVPNSSVGPSLELQALPLNLIAQTDLGTRLINFARQQIDLERRTTP
jgi:uncharacterized repeat protein (TIGR03837 family)